MLDFYLPNYIKGPPSFLFFFLENNFLFQVQSFVQDRFNEDDIYLGANRGTIFLFLRGGSLGKMSDPVRSVIPECKGLNSPDPVGKAGGFCDITYY